MKITRLLFFALITSSLVLQPLVAENTNDLSSVQTFFYGTVFGLTGAAALYVARRGNFKGPVRKFFSLQTLPWNRQKKALETLQQELKEFQTTQNAKLHELNTQLGAHKEMLTKQGKVLTQQGLTLDKHGGHLTDLLKKTDTIKTDVGQVKPRVKAIEQDTKAIKEQTERIEGHTEVLHSALIRLTQTIQENKGPLSQFLSWLSTRGIITPEPPKEFQKISSGIRK